MALALDPSTLPFPAGGVEPEETPVAHLITRSVRVRVKAAGLAEHVPS